jgi:hypothetical protein
MKFLIVILVAIGISTLFYWNEYRPSQIKRVCYKESITAAQQKFISNGPSNWIAAGSDKTPKEVYDEEVSKGSYNNSDYDSYYSKCLTKNGI